MLGKVAVTTRDRLSGLAGQARVGPASLVGSKARVSVPEGGAEGNPYAPGTAPAALGCTFGCQKRIGGGCVFVGQTQRDNPQGSCCCCYDSCEGEGDTVCY
jgi:hypothetical protein